jgi:serine protease Do
LFVTNEHVVAGNTAVHLILDPSLKTQRIIKAQVIRSDRANDFALLRAEGVKDLPVLALGDSDRLEELEEVIAFGFPFGNSLRVTKDGYPSISINKGAVNALRRKADELHRIQVDVSLNPGNSGGALVNLQGKVVGVVVSGVRGSGVSFVIPANLLTRFLAVPDIQFTAPGLTRSNQHDSTVFEARIVSILPPTKPLSVELVLRAGNDSERVFEM